MTDPEAIVLELFERASELDEPERSRFLDERCPDPDTRRRIDGMLAFDSGRSLFLEAPQPPGSGAFVNELRSDARVGSYRIEERIASGGMGTVYSALQDDPRRRVALKVLRSGWCDDGALRRFRFEAEVLGRLRHPGIAQIHEAGIERSGTSDREPFPGSFEGWPWFAMEFVEGARPITAFADGEGLGLEERIELFETVCDAVQYGHQRGVVHRDLKPSNVLVDGEGRAKVIDFGLATMRGPERDASLELTRTGALLGTLTYMSPEQFRGADVDTRSDVYALGVILHELLCGRPPFDFSSTPVAEAAWRADQETPPEPWKLRADLPRELGWVLLRALEKEPDRRYASVADLAADLRRFLRDEVLEAGPPSRVYRLRKFVRRNRLAVVAGAMLVTVVVGGAVASSIGFLRARAEWERASDEADKFRAVNAVLLGMFDSVLPGQDGRDVRAFELLDRAREEIDRGFEDRPDVQASLADALARCYLQLGMLEQALPLVASAHAHLLATRPEADPERMQVLGDRLVALGAAGKPGDARALLDQIPERSELEREDLGVWFDLRRAAASIEQVEWSHAEAERALAELEREIEAELGADAQVLVKLREDRRNALRRLGRSDEAEELARALLEQAIAKYGSASFRAASARSRLGTIVMEGGDDARAIPELEAAVAALEETAGPRHFATLDARNSLALALRNARRFQEALAIQKRVVAERVAAFGPEHPETLNARRNLAAIQSHVTAPHEAVEILRDVLAIQERVCVESDIAITVTLRQLGVQLELLGAFGEARELLERALERHERDQGEEHPETIRARMELANLTLGEGRIEDALPLLERSVRSCERIWGSDDRSLRNLEANYATALAGLGRFEDAVAVLTELVQRDDRLLAADDPDRLQALCSLGVAQYRVGDDEQAERSFRAALDLGAAHFEAEDPVWIVARRDAAQAFMRRGLWPEVIVLLAECIADGERSPRLHWEELAFTRLVHAVALAQVGRHREAEPQLVLAHEAYADRLGPDDPSTLRAAAKLAELREVLGAAGGASAGQEPDDS